MKTNILKVIPILTCLLTMVYSCKDKKAETFRTFGRVMDYDKNTYDVIQIGCQYWMKQNLRTTHYNNGDPIEKIVENNECCTLNKIGYYADYSSNLIVDTIYGKFYNWHAVETGKLAPKGWHVATKEDWEILKKTIGPDATGNKLRTTYGWNDINTIAGKGTDDYAFSALSTGYKNWGSGYWPASNPISQLNVTVFWTSTNDGSACNRDGQNYPYSVIIGLANKDLIMENCNCHNFEYSVRCVRDDSCKKNKNDPQ